MNKLRKRSPISFRNSCSPVRQSPQLPPTQALSSPRSNIPPLNLVNQTTPTLSRDSNAVVVRNHGTLSAPASTRTSVSSVEPRSSVEQYWAARALTAETLLSARLAHHQELRSLTSFQDAKRSRDLAQLSKVHEAMHAKMEKFVIALLACLLVFVLLVVYLLTHSDRRKGRRTSWWALPSHFTIPILSPFTSVVEHETSVVGTRTIAIFLVVLALLGYAVFRHWGHLSLRFLHTQTRT